MDFISTQNFDSEAERLIWESLKVALHDEPGYCWHRYPITSVHGPRIEPDIVILHPLWGLNIVEVKGCWIENIEYIEGHTWYMKSWDQEEMEPFDQAQKHMWAILDRLKRAQNGTLRNEQGNCKIVGKAFVGLPFITEQDWRKEFSDHISAPKWEVIFSSDLDPQRIKQRFIDAPIKQHELSEEDWQVALSILRGSEGIQRKPRRPTKRTDSRAAYLRKVEQQLAALDLEQHRVAIQIPAGPQRIRGLAGTGKTVVLAQKAAYMHVKNPEWNIVFTFYSRSLYDQVRTYIQRFVQQLSQGEIDEPNWDKIHIWHGWGASKQEGIYRYLCNRMDMQFRTYSNALSTFGTSSGNYAFNMCCRELIVEEVPELFDAILIDEAQDFGENYFRLCYAALKHPKRLIWGYDEVQSLEELKIPTAETLFGQDIDGNPLVDLDGEYAGDIEKDLILYHCYRNPRPVLLAAHAFGLGLLRKGGAIQFIDTVGGWQDIGYEIEGLKDNKLQAGQQISLIRPSNNSPHQLERTVGYRNLVEWHVFDSRSNELDWIVNDIARNIEEEELLPEEIVVIALDSRKVDKEYELLHNGLESKGIRSIRVGTDVEIDIFRSKGAVTITSAFRAKGNEASVVYVYGFENVGGDYDEVRKRNRAFTAMTRTRGWLILTGIGNPAQNLFDEIEAALQDIGKVTFVVPDMAKIKRNLETYENQRKRERAKKAQQSIKQLIKDLTDVDPNDISSEEKKKLYRLLFGDKID